MKNVKTFNHKLSNEQVVTIRYKWYRGFPGSRECPPEPPEATILSVKQEYGSEMDEDLFEKFSEEIEYACAKDHETAIPDRYEDEKHDRN